MRKLRTLYMSMLAVASLGLMTSCGDDNDDPTPTPTVAEMNIFSARILGNQNNTNSSAFYSSANGVVKNSTDAKASAGTIDLVYYHSSPTSGDTAAASHAATIASPKDAKAMAIYNNPTTGLQTWIKTNATMFKRIGRDATAYNKPTNGTEVANVYKNSTAPAVTSMKKLKELDVFAFVTEAGKHGVAIVTNVEVLPGSNFSTELEMDVKMEK